MEPVSAIGLVGSVLGLTDVVTRSINRLSTLKTKYRQADVSLSALIGTLYVLNAALYQLVDQYPSTHYDRAHVNIPLTCSLDGCHAIISTLEGRIDRLEKGKGGYLTIKGKASLVWHDEDIKETLALLDRQVNALSLLLQVMQSKSLNEERALLQEEDSITVLRLARESTESLYAINDVSSRQTRWSLFSENSSNLSRNFDFDHLVLGSRAYRSAARHIVRKLIRRQPSAIDQDTHSSISSRAKIASPIVRESFVTSSLDDGQLPLLSSKQALVTSSGPLEQLKQDLAMGPPTGRRSSAIEGRGYQFARTHQRLIFDLKGSLAIKVDSEKADDPYMRSKTIDVELKEAGKRAAREVKVLVFGNDQLQTDLHRQLEISYGTDERISFKPTIYRSLIQSMCALFEAMDMLEIPFNDPKRCCYVAELYTWAEETKDIWLIYSLASALKSLWADDGVQTCFTRAQARGIECLPPVTLKRLSHFADDLSRLTDPYYIPTVEDILLARTQPQGMLETTFDLGQLTYQFCSLSNQNIKPNKWLHLVDDIRTILFLVDITCYADMERRDPPIKDMRGCLEVFESLVNDRYLLRKGFILIFVNCHRLPTSFHTDSPQDFFPDYLGGHDPSAFQEYLRNEFRLRSIDRSRQAKLYCHFVGDLATDASLPRYIIQDIQDVIILEALSEPILRPC